nr:putative ribonuclease h protein [Quercus suber]
MTKTEPTSKPMVVLGSQQPPVVVVRQSKERENFQEEKRVRDVDVETKDLITLERVEKSRVFGDGFEECIEEIDRVLKMFDKGDSLKPDIGEVRTSEEDISSEHIKKLDSDQSRYAEKGTTQGGLVGKHLGTELSGKPHGKAADLATGRHLGTNPTGQPCGKGADLLVDAMFLPFEAQRIKGIPICVTNQDDCMAWPKCKTGSYSVKSGYQLLCESEAKEVPSGSSDEGVKHFWKNIWRLKVPNKVRIFLWRACSSALPTKVGLYKRKIVDSVTCDQCLKRIENEVHAVWGCDCIQMVWAAPFATVRTKHPSVENMCDLVSCVHEETGELEKFAMVAWAIWQWRNKLRSKEASTPVHKIFQSAMSLLAEIQLKKPKLITQGLASPSHWQPPPQNSVKANFDGAVFGDFNEARIGGFLGEDWWVANVADDGFAQDR